MRHVNWKQDSAGSDRESEARDQMEAMETMKAWMTPSDVRDHFLTRWERLREIAQYKDTGRFITVHGQRFWLANPGKAGHFTAERVPAWREYLYRPVATIRRCSTLTDMDSWRFKQVRREVFVADGVVADRDIVVIQAAGTAPALRGTGFALEMLKTVLRQGHQECFVQGEAPNENAIRWHRRLDQAMPSRMLHFPEYGERGNPPSTRIAPGKPLNPSELLG